MINFYYPLLLNKIHNFFLLSLSNNLITLCDHLLIPFLLLRDDLLNSSSNSSKVTVLANAGAHPFSSVLLTQFYLSLTCVLSSLLKLSLDVCTFSRLINAFILHYS